MPYKIIVMLLLLCCAIPFGCSKKKSKEAAALDSLEIASLTKEPAKEIFEEFYEDDKEKKGGNTFDFPSDSRPEFNPNGRYVVQVSCVMSQRLATNIAATLESKGYPSYIAEVVNPTPDLTGMYYRVRVGGFTGLSAAKRFGDDFLRRDGYEFWVDNRSNDNVGMSGSGLGDYGSGYERADTPAPQPAHVAPQQEQNAPETSPSYEWNAQEAVSTPVEETPPPPPPPPTPADEWGADTSNW